MVYCTNIVSQPSKSNSQIAMSLAAAERARKESELFTERVDQLIPDDHGIFQRDSLKDVNDKIAILKKNVAYLMLQNINLIDILMDAENTVNTFCMMNEIEKPFAASDTFPESLPTGHRTKHESWCDPIIDFAMFDDKAEELESQKSSLTQNFVSNNLREYIMREGMIMHLKPNLAVYLFPGIRFDKDSDKNSGAREEIMSPDEVDINTSNNEYNGKFSLLKKSFDIPSSKLDIRGLSIDGREGKVKTMRRQLDTSSRSTTAGMVSNNKFHRGEISGKRIEDVTKVLKGKLRAEAIIRSRFSEIATKFDEPKRSPKLEEISRKLPVSKVNKTWNPSSLTNQNNEIWKTINARSPEDIFEFPNKRNDPKAPRPRLKHEDLIDVPKLNNRTSATPHHPQSSDPLVFGRVDDEIQCEPVCETKSDTGYTSEGLSSFSITCSQGMLTTKGGGEVIGTVQGIGVESPEENNEKKGIRDTKPSKSFSVFSPDDPVAILSPKKINLTEVKNKDTAIESNSSNPSLVGYHRNSMDAEIPIRRATFGGKKLDSEPATPTQSGQWEIRGPLLSIRNNIGMDNDMIDDVKGGNTLQRSMSFTPEQKNFSSKTSRGNKMRKSKRIEETQKVFQSTSEAKDKKISSAKVDNLVRDTSLWLIEAGGVSKNPFAGTGGNNIFNPNYNGAKLKSQSSEVLSYAHRSSSFGDR